MKTHLTSFCRLFRSDRPRVPLTSFDLTKNVCNGGKSIFTQIADLPSNDAFISRRVDHNSKEPNKCLIRVLDVDDCEKDGKNTSFTLIGAPKLASFKRAQAPFSYIAQAGRKPYDICVSIPNSVSLIDYIFILLTGLKTRISLINEDAVRSQIMQKINKLSLYMIAQSTLH